jgi:hypothetical protein
MAVDDERPNVTSDDRAAAAVGHRDAGERDHRLAPQDVAHGVLAEWDVEPAQDDVRPDRQLHPGLLERDPLLLVPARACAGDREQIVALHADRVLGHGVTVIQARELDLVEPEALLPVEEIGQALAEHRDLAGNRAIAGEALELDTLHAVDGTSRDPAAPRNVRTGTRRERLQPPRVGTMKDALGGHAMADPLSANVRPRQSQRHTVLTEHRMAGSAPFRTAGRVPHRPQCGPPARYSSCVAIPRRDGATR